MSMDMHGVNDDVRASPSHPSGGFQPPPQAGGMHNDREGVSRSLYAQLQSVVNTGNSIAQTVRAKFAAVYELFQPSDPAAQAQFLSTDADTIFRTALGVIADLCHVPPADLPSTVAMGSKARALLMNPASEAVPGEGRKLLTDALHIMSTANEKMLHSVQSKGTVPVPMAITVKSDFSSGFEEVAKFGESAEQNDSNKVVMVMSAVHIIRKEGVKTVSQEAIMALLLAGHPDPPRVHSGMGEVFSEFKSAKIVGEGAMDGGPVLNVVVRFNSGAAAQKLLSISKAYENSHLVRLSPYKCDFVKDLCAALDAACAEIVAAGGTINGNSAGFFRTGCLPGTNQLTCIEPRVDQLHKLKSAMKELQERVRQPLPARVVVPGPPPTPKKKSKEPPATPVRARGRQDQPPAQPKATGKRSGPPPPARFGGGRSKSRGPSPYPRVHNEQYTRTNQGYPMMMWPSYPMMMGQGLMGQGMMGQGMMPFGPDQMMFNHPQNSRGGRRSSWSGR